MKAHIEQVEKVVTTTVTEDVVVFTATVAEAIVIRDVVGAAFGNHPAPVSIWSALHDLSLGSGTAHGVNVYVKDGSVRANKA